MADKSDERVDFKEEEDEELLIYSGDAAADEEDAECSQEENAAEDREDNLSQGEDDAQDKEDNLSPGEDEAQDKENNSSPDSNDNAAERLLDPELEAVAATVREMEQEAARLRRLQSNEFEADSQEVPSSSIPSSTSGNADSYSDFPTWEERMEADRRSIYVGNVDYGATAMELEEHFHGCGNIHRVNILCNEDGSPKGYAYIEFADRESVNTALALNMSEFRGRPIKVSLKRTNLPGLSSTDRSPRGSYSGYRGGGRFASGHWRGAHYPEYSSRRGSPSGIMRTSSRNPAYYSPY